MIIVNLGRRRFVNGLSWALGLALVPKFGWAANFISAQTRLLSVMARRLFPHRLASDRPYMAAAATLEERAATSHDLAALINSGVASLQRRSHGDWPAQSEDKQVTILTRIENSSFFTTVQQHVLTHVYRDPEIWKLIGYEGSSVEYGGYLHRGFNDIDWLPEE